MRQVQVPFGNGYENVLLITVLCHRPNKLATPTVAQTYKSNIHFWAVLHEQFRVSSGINLLEYCLCLANSLKFMLQKQFSELNSEREMLGHVYNLASGKINHPLNAIILYFTLKLPPYK